MNVRCTDCDTHFALMPNGPVVGAACPGCGGTRLEPDQPSPVHSDGDLRDMVNPDTGQDMGGNPLQEGIMADWQPAYKRDESFASVRQAAPTFTELTVTPGPMGIHSRVINLLHKLHSVTIDGHPVSFEDGPNKQFLYGRYGHPGAENQRPVTVGAHHPAFADVAAKLIADSNGDPRVVREEMGQLQQGLQAGQIPLPPAPTARPDQYGIEGMPGQPYLTSKVSFDLDMGDWDKSPAHIFMVTPGGKVVSSPMPNTHEQLAAEHGLLRPDINNPFKGYSLGTKYDNGDIDFDQHETTHSPAALEQMLWGHFGQQVVVNPNLQPTTTDERWHGQGVDMDRLYQQGINDRLEGQQLDLVPGRREERQRAIQERGKPFGYYNDPYINRGGSVTAKVGEHMGNMEPYLPWAYEEPKTSAFLAPLMGVAGGDVLGTAAPWLMRGALMGTGSNLVQGLFGGGGQQQSGPSMPPQTDQLSQVAKTADLETPHTNPVLHDSPDGDTQQFNDGDNSTAFQNPNMQDSGASGEDNVPGGIGTEQPTMDSFAPNSPSLERFKMLTPLIMHYYNSEESGAKDPLLRELHGMMEGELPGYLDRGDEQAANHLLEQWRQPDAVTASIHEAVGVYQNTPIPPAQMQMGDNQMDFTQQPGGGLPGVGPQGKCPFCGGVQTADGTCPQCGAKAGPQGITTPNSAPSTAPGMQPGMPQVAPGGVPMQQPWTHAKTAGDTQGPTTPEQILAVQDLLISQGRDDEVANVRRHPELYARELAILTHRPNVAPTVDPSQEPPQPPVPPTAPMPMPGMSAPGGPPTPGGSIPPGMSSVRRSWKIAAPDDPNVIDTPAADQHHQRDLTQEQDSSHSWQDTNGDPLQADQVYVLHNPQYTIPDIVRVEQIKPDEVVLTFLGQFQTQSPDGAAGPGMNQRHAVPLREVQMEHLTFEPQGQAEAQEQYPSPDAPDAAPVNTEPQMAPDVNQQAGPLRSHVEAAEAEDPDDDSCPQCRSPHVQSSMSSPTTLFHECFRCGKTWETREQEYGVDTPSDHLSWIMNDSGPGGDDFFANYERIQGMKQMQGTGSRDLGAIAAKDPRLQEIKERLDTNREARVAGRKFTPREQQEFINESGSARNADMLDLDGTHYEATRTKGDYERANAANVPDEHLFLGF